MITGGRHGALDWVRTHMPAESADALIRFTAVNPGYRGAQWDDCLDILLDSDSHIEVTDPMFDALAGTDIPPVLASAVTVTLLWASKSFYDASLALKALSVKATIENNGGWS